MEILERPYGLRAGFAPLDNIGYFTFEVSLEGEVYTYAIPSTAECCKAERVGSNKWKIRKYDFSGNPIECVIRTDVLVGFAWYNIDENYGKIVLTLILSAGVKNFLVFQTEIKLKPYIRRIMVLVIMLLNLVMCGIPKL